VYYNGLFDVKNPEHRLRVSMTAQVTIVSGETKNVLLVPVAAIENDEHQHAYVRVLEHDRVIKKTIQLGLKDSLNAQVLNGLNDGDSIILGDSKSSEAGTSNSGRMMPPPPGP
jgi:macrolide-specific efflux system membrane fusion protein